MAKTIDDEDLPLILYALDEAIAQTTQEISILSTVVRVDGKFIGELADKIDKLVALKEKLSA